MKRIAISIPDSLFQEAEALASQLHLSRSQLYAIALREYVRARSADAVTEAINRVFEKVDQTPDPFLEILHRETFLRDPW